MTNAVAVLPADDQRLISALVVTGAFHEDGLADTFDALVGGWDREQRLRIFKDPTHGTYGVAALALSIIRGVRRVLVSWSLVVSCMVSFSVARVHRGGRASLRAAKARPTYAASAGEHVGRGRRNGGAWHEAPLPHCDHGRPALPALRSTSPTPATTPS